MTTMPTAPAGPVRKPEDRIATLLSQVERRAPEEAVALLEKEPEAVIAQVLAQHSPAMALEILLRFEEPQRQAILAAAPPDRRDQWTRNQAYPEGSVGRLMERPVGVFSPDLTVRDVVARLRELVKQAFITYGYVTDGAGTLVGIIVMRDLLLADPAQPLWEIMLQNPFSLRPSLSVADAMREVLHRHYPVYPVCDEKGRLVGLVRGSDLFAQEAFEITAQPGRMVGVDEEERLTTPWWRSFKFRHPWLQLNLLTALLAAAVVGVYEETIGQVVALAVFLPVLAGQSGNTGCQALAVTLRGMTLGELQKGRESGLVTKEALLGLLNGILVGVTAGLAMYIYATMQHRPDAWLLSAVVFLAMIGSCLISGVFGALVPMAIKKFGTDPATASSIFLTTVTDVASMGMFLWLATWLVL